MLTRPGARPKVDMSPAIVAWRAGHALIAVGFLASIAYVWWCALSGRRGPLLRAAVASLAAEGVVVAANHGDCPLGAVGERIGDPVPLFELVLPQRLARRAVPALGAVTAGGLALLAYRRSLREWVLTWGATTEEASRRLPGDELLESADGVSTRAIGIAAPAAAIWPWLAQMGPAPRGGAYTYDWIESLFGLKMHSVDRVLSEFQHPEIGDTIALGPNRMRLELVEPEEVLSWRSEDGNWIWTFVLEEGDGQTRLISRNRFRLPSLAARVAMLPMEPGSLVMERKMLLGIKQRAEGLAAEPSPS